MIQYPLICLTLIIVAYRKLIGTILIRNNTLKNSISIFTLLNRHYLLIKAGEVYNTVFTCPIVVYSI